VRPEAGPGETQPEARNVPKTWANAIVVVSGNQWDGMGSSDRHLALRLAKRGPVVFVDKPTQTWSLPGHTCDVPTPGVLRIIPKVPPGMYRPGSNSLLPHLVARAVTTTLSDLRTTASAVIVACPSPILSVLTAPRRVLYITDDWAAGAELMGVPRSRLLKVQARQVASADVVIAVSEVLAEQYRALGHRKVAVVPNGCDLELLAGVDESPAAADVHLRPPVAGLLGHLSERISLSHLEAVADRSVSLLLVGPRQNGYGGARFDELVKRPNVCWVGERPYAQVPSYLRLIDVGLTPYAPSSFNRASSPLKTLEYLAAGRGSVSTDLPGVRAFATDEVTIANTPQSFADAVERTLRLRRTPGIVAARQDAVAPHSWSLRALQVLDVLDLKPNFQTMSAAAFPEPLNRLRRRPS
jgi:teichuronic acid biosynthesis glycosyltransferase TuaH